MTGCGMQAGREYWGCSQRGRGRQLSVLPLTAQSTCRAYRTVLFETATYSSAGCRSLPRQPAELTEQLSLKLQHISHVERGGKIEPKKSNELNPESPFPFSQMELFFVQRNYRKLYTRVLLAWAYFCPGCIFFRVNSFLRVCLMFTYLGPS